MVTTGANQAFVNVVLTLLDAGDTAMLFKPYYFNHIMALQMCGGGQPEREVIFGPTDGKMLPDVVALEKVLRERKASDHPVKMLVFTSPNNPTGMILPRSTLESISELCVKFGVWLVMDNTYEEFTYDGNEHAAIEGDHVLNIFSFSKAYGLMGWRIGYLAYPPALAPQLLKVQDTIPICPCQISQHAAIGALTAGHSWVQEHVTNLGPNLLAVREALSPLGEGAVTGGEGAIYLMCRLPPQYLNDVEVVKWMAYKHGVCLIPGH
jgi:katanin p60 ATPase-containing subunit A1